MDFILWNLQTIMPGKNNDDAELLEAFVSRCGLQNPHLEKELVRTVFELRAMMVNGEYPQTFSVC